MNGVPRVALLGDSFLRFSYTGRRHPAQPVLGLNRKESHPFALPIRIPSEAGA